MSTAPTVTPVAQVSSFGFKSVAHFFATAFSDLKKGLKFAEDKALPAAQSALKTAETYTAALVPFLPQASAALTVERALDAAAGELLAAVHTTDAIQGASVVDLKLSIDSYNAFKAFIEQQKDALAKLGYAF